MSFHRKQLNVPIIIMDIFSMCFLIIRDCKAAAAAWQGRKVGWKRASQFLFSALSIYLKQQRGIGAFSKLALILKMCFCREGRLLKALVQRCITAS